MGWFERIIRKKEPSKKTARKRYKTPMCDKCSVEIKCLDVSIGEVMEDMGACVYSGSEGHLYEPLFDGVICSSCNMMLCDSCQQALRDKTMCPKCGGFLITITEHRLPKAD